MSTFRLSKLQHSTVLFLYSKRSEIDLEPEYQRLSDIWTSEKRQLLVDSVLNEFDIPKIYLHQHRQPKRIRDQVVDFAVIDGKQRLEALWKFIDGDFSLPMDFEYLHDDSVAAGGLSYGDLAKKYPKLKIKFDSYPLDVVVIETEELDLIEDMFSRLNEAVPLNAAEKRNAFGGPLTQCIRELAQHRFFKSRLPFDNKRYRHFDLACKFLLLAAKHSIVDTKKVYLDDFVRRTTSSKSAKAALAEATRVVDKMAEVFVKRDQLLRSIGGVVLFFHVFRLAIAEGWLDQIQRKDFHSFELLRGSNRIQAEQDLKAADYELLEYDRLVQSPNDAFSQEFRLRVLLTRAFGRCPDATGSSSTAESSGRRNGVSAAGRGPKKRAGSKSR